MENDTDRLQKKAEELKQKVVPGAEPVSLDQPFPEDMVSQRVPFKPIDAMSSPPQKEETHPEVKIEDPEVIPSTGEPVVGNFKLTDLLKIPLRPPEAVKTEGFKATTNSNVLFFTCTGALIAIAGGIILFTISVVLGIILIVLGVSAILMSGFGPMS